MNRWARIVVLVGFIVIAATPFLAPWQGWEYVPGATEGIGGWKKTSKIAPIFSPPEFLYGTHSSGLIGDRRHPPRVNYPVLATVWITVGTLIVAVMVLGFTSVRTGERVATPPSSIHKASEAPKVYLWRRLFARLFDAVWMTILLIEAVAALPVRWRVSLGIYGIVAVIFVASWFLEALALSAFGTTPGKALLRITIRESDGTIPTFLHALSRSVLVFFFGSGAGIPLVSWATSLISASRLRKQGSTAWDDLLHLKVAHGSVTGVRKVVFSTTIAGILVVGGVQRALYEDTVTWAFETAPVGAREELGVVADEMTFSDWYASCRIPKNGFQPKIGFVWAFPGDVNDPRSIMMPDHNLSDSEWSESVAVSMGRAKKRFPQLADGDHPLRQKLNGLLSTRYAEPRFDTVMASPYWPEFISEDFAAENGMAPAAPFDQAPVTGAGLAASNRPSSQSATSQNVSTGSASGDRGGLPAASNSPTVVRTWTSADGRMVEAVLVSATRTMVTIRRTNDGQEFSIEQSTLSFHDRDFIKNWLGGALRRDAN